MALHERFSFASKLDLLRKARDLGVVLPFSDDWAILFREGTVASRRVANRFAVHPMEGFDSEPDGSPSNRVFRRYERYAKGGSGLIWFEASSVTPQGKSNPHQMMLTEKNLERFKLLIESTRSAAKQSLGSSKDVFCVLQLTHSGRFSKPEGRPKPQYVRYMPGSEGKGEKTKILSDEALDILQERFVQSARFAHVAGFDAVDIKACHGYLINDLLSSFTREDSRYGGSFANRTRFLLETIQRIRSEIPGLLLAVRLNVYDGIPHPYGFGVACDGSLAEDIDEPTALIDRMTNSGCSLLNITMGIPHVNPHLGRPFDRPAASSTVPEEHPLEGVGRLLRLTGRMQKMFPGTPCVGTGYSWLRHFFPHVGAAAVERGEVSFVGLGRSSFAYPDAPMDLKEDGLLNPRKVCVACSCCTELIRAGLPGGCVIRDKEFYAEEYKKHFVKGGTG